MEGAKSWPGANGLHSFPNQARGPRAYRNWLELRSETSHQPVTLFDIEPIDPILEALTDTYSRRILLSAIPHARTVREICSEQGLPQSSTYRTVKGLVKNDLMMVDRSVLSPDGKKYATYRTTFSYVCVEMKNGSLAVKVGLNPALLDKLSSSGLAAAWRGEREGYGAFRLRAGTGTT